MSVTVTPIDKTQTARSFWGLSRSMVANIVTGVSEGFSRKLELQGVGYRSNAGQDAEIVAWL